MKPPLVIFGLALAMAASHPLPSCADQIDACVKTKTGRLRILDPVVADPKPCSDKETALSWLNPVLDPGALLVFTVQGVVTGVGAVTITPFILTPDGRFLQGVSASTVGVSDLPFVLPTLIDPDPAFGAYTISVRVESSTSTASVALTSVSVVKAPASTQVTVGVNGGVTLPSSAVGQINATFVNILELP